MEDDCGGIKPMKLLPPKNGATKKTVKKNIKNVIIKLIIEYKFSHTIIYISC